MEMRRKDRRIEEDARIDGIIRACDCCRLGFADGDAAYIVPVNFAFVRENGKRVFYIHGARMGRKAELIRAKGVCGFEMDTGHGVQAGEKPCDYSFYYQSVIGKGRIAFIEDAAEKAAALNHIMAVYSDRNDWEFPAEMLKAMGVLRLEVDELSCKEHAGPKG